MVPSDDDDCSRIVWMMGHPLAHEELGDYWEMLLYFSYRSKIPPFEYNQRSIKSDCGWGCTLRSGQMMLANAYMRHLMKADNLFLDVAVMREKSGYIGACKRIIEWFNDTKDSPYSIVKILQVSRSKELQLGPHTVARALTNLVNIHASACFLDIRACFCDDGTIDIDQIFPGDDPKPATLFVSLRLGVDKINLAYEPLVLLLFKLPSFLGIIGGSSRSSYYFAAMRSKQLVYFDPHVSQSYCLPESDCNDETYHTNQHYFMDFASLNPSLTLGFYYKEPGDLIKDFEAIQRRFHKLEVPPIFQIIAKESGDQGMSPL